MRDPKRIPGILATIEQVWEQYPDLRLGQLLLNVFRDPPLYAVEDLDLAKALQAAYPDRGYNHEHEKVIQAMVTDLVSGDQTRETLTDLVGLLRPELPAADLVDQAMLRAFGCDGEAEVSGE